MMTVYRISFSLIFQLILVLDVTTAAPHIAVSPAQISEGLTEYVDINCTFSLEGTSGMAALMSLILARAESSEDNFVDLASVNEYSHDSVNLLVTDGGTAAGGFSSSGESFIEVRWQYPTAAHSGVYQCLAQGLDPFGHVIVMSDTAQVTVHELNIAEYANRLREMDVIIKNLTQKMSELENHTQILEEHISDADTCSRRLQDMVTTLLTERQSGIIEKFEGPFTYNDERYYISKDGFSSIEVSKAVCQHYGGQLAVIDDDQEHHAIRDFLNNSTLTGITYVYIEGTDSGHSGSWVISSTNQSLPYIDWFQGQPNNLPSEDCLLLCVSGVWQMCDYPCHFDPPHADYRYICEVQPVQDTPLC